MNEINLQLKEIINLKNNKLVRDVTVMAGGTATAQLIVVLFSPVITRLYGPDAFGILGVFTAVSRMIIPMANLIYADAIVLPAAEREAKALIKLSFLITIFVFFMVMAIMLAFHNQIAHFMGLDSAGVYLLIVPFFVMSNSFEHILRKWLIRRKQFKSISKIAVAQAAVTNLAKSGFGLFMGIAPVLILLNTLGYFLRALLTWIVTAPSLTSNWLSSLKDIPNQVAELKKAAFEYRDFPLFSLPQNLIFSFSQNLPTLILAAFFGPLPAGFYALSKRVLSLPADLISRSVGMAYLPRLAESANRGKNLQPGLIKATAVLALLGLAPFSIVIFFGPPLFEFVFGSEWLVAGEYARWLSVGLFFQFINVPCVKAIPILGLQGHKLVYEVLSTAVHAGALAFGAFYLQSDLMAIALFSGARAILYVVLILGVIVLSKNRTRRKSTYLVFADKYDD